MRVIVSYVLLAIVGLVIGSCLRVNSATGLILIFVYMRSSVGKRDINNLFVFLFVRSFLLVFSFPPHFPIRQGPSHLPNFCLHLDDLSLKGNTSGSFSLFCSFFQPIEIRFHLFVLIFMSQQSLLTIIDLHKRIFTSSLIRFILSCL
jgi:hypothetical protein